MPPLTAAALRTQAASRALAPLYLITGDDEVQQRAVVSAIVATVEDDLQAFNLDRLYGSDAEATVDRLIACAQTLPMLAPRRVVVVLEAEKLLAPKRESRAADEALERLERFVEAPPDHATVVFVCGSLDRRRRIVQRLEQQAPVVTCSREVSAGEAEQWVTFEAARAGVVFDPGAVRALVAQTGGDLVRLRAGFDRVTLYALGRPAVTAGDVRDAVSPAPDAPANFGIGNAIGAGDVREALAELARALDAGAHPLFVMGQIRAAAEKLPASALPAAIDAVFRTELALKSSAGDPGMLLERLVVQVCGTGSGGRRRGRPLVRTQALPRIRGERPRVRLADAP